MEPHVLQLLSDTEALAVCQQANARLKLSSTMPKERRAEVRWTVGRSMRYLEGAADPATAVRVLDALQAFAFSDLTRLKLLNANAVTEVAAFLAAPDSGAEPAAVAARIAAASEGGAAGRAARAGDAAAGKRPRADSA